MTSAEIRQSFLDFFREKQHTIVPSSSLLPDAPNLLFTNAGMNQFVPIFLGQQKPPWKPPRVADTQKCIRAGGKHNDLEDVGLDTYHHTFFEMLGNWSFGDYFKKEAIEWAWELVVERWKFPPQRLYATVYQPGPDEPSEFDQEAYDHWARSVSRSRSRSRSSRRQRQQEADNFWMMGDTGPCGPCSELHVDLTPDGDTRGALVNKDDPRCIEIWNLVFIQFNANPDGTFSPLPQRHVDTGMGFERVDRDHSRHEKFHRFLRNDLELRDRHLPPDLRRARKTERQKIRQHACRRHGSARRKRAGKDRRRLPRHRRSHPRAFVSRSPTESFHQTKAAVMFCVAFLRRAVRYGRTLGFHEPFFFKLVDVVAKTMGDVFPEVRTQQSKIKETIRREEESFNKTLDKG